MDPVLPPPPIKVTERGVFLVMKETPIYEDPRIDSKVQGQGKKYDVFDVLNTRKDQRGVLWHQMLREGSNRFHEGKTFRLDSGRKIFLGQK